MNRKKLFSWLLTLVLLLSTASLAILPVSANSEHGTCGNGVTWDLNKDTGELVVSGTGKMNYGELAPGLPASAPWYMMRKYVLTVRVTEGITELCENAFYNCPNLTSVSLPSTVTVIGGFAFADCPSLTSVNIPNGVTAISDWAFNDCTSLQSLDLPDGITTIGDGAFNGCKALKELDLPASVRSVKWEAFTGCNALVTRENGVTYIDDWVISVAKGRINVTIKDGTVGIAEYAFESCSYLEVVSIPDSVRAICDSAFTHCSKLRSVSLPQGVTTLELSAFYNCYSLETVSLPSTLTSIEDFAFAHCTSLQKIFFAGTEAQWNTVPKGTYWNDTGTEIAVLFHAHDYSMPAAYNEELHRQSCECGEIRYDTHRYGDWKIVREATESEAGEKQQQCLCGHAVSESIPPRSTSSVPVASEATSNATQAHTTDTEAPTPTGCHSTVSGVAAMLLLLPSAVLIRPARKRKALLHTKR